MFLLLTEVVHSVVGMSSSKLIPLLEGDLFIYNFVVFALVIVTITYSSILRSTLVLSQTSYLPLMTSLNIVLNGLAGFFFWDDVIINVGAYVCAYLFFVLGLYLVSDYDILPGTFWKHVSKASDEKPVLITGLIKGSARVITKDRDKISSNQIEGDSSVSSSLHISPPPSLGNRSPPKEKAGIGEYAA